MRIKDYLQLIIFVRCLLFLPEVEFLIWNPSEHVRKGGRSRSLSTAAESAVNAKSRSISLPDLMASS
jgi:hypothetical protein